MVRAGIGFWTRPSLVILGGILVFVTFGHLVLAPMFVANTFILTRTALLLLVLVLPSEADSYAMDSVLKGKRQVGLTSERGRQAHGQGTS